MHIIAIENYNRKPSMKAGLYFTKNSNVLFNKNSNIKYVTDEVVKVSQEGSRYIEDTGILQVIKDKFAEIPFIKNLSEQFDTFIHFKEAPKCERTSQFENVSYAKIIWADSSKESAEQREFIGRSPVSQKLATKKLFKNIENNQFADISK